MTRKLYCQFEKYDIRPLLRLDGLKASAGRVVSTGERKRKSGKQCDIKICRLVDANANISEFDDVSANVLLLSIREFKEVKNSFIPFSEQRSISKKTLIWLRQLIPYNSLFKMQRFEYPFYAYESCGLV